MGFVIWASSLSTNQSLSGAIIQMVNHGIVDGALFLDRGLLFTSGAIRAPWMRLGGCWKVMPVLGTLALIVTLSSMDCPG